MSRLDLLESSVSVLFFFFFVSFLFRSCFVLESFFFVETQAKSMAFTKFENSCNKSILLLLK